MLGALRRAADRGLARLGVRVVRILPNPYAVETAADRATAERFVEAVVPALLADGPDAAGPAADARHYFTGRRAAAIRLLFEACDRGGVTFAGRSLLDVGCHVGFLASVAAGRYPGCRVHGCDVVEDRLRAAARVCPTGAFFRAGLDDLPQERRFDVVLCTQVLEHLVDPYAAVARLLETTEPGGALALTVPDGREDRFPAKRHNAEAGSYWGHINFWSPESWPLFLRRAAPGARVETAKLGTGQLFGLLFKPA